MQRRGGREGGGSDVRIEMHVLGYIYREGLKGGVMYTYTYRYKGVGGG